MDTVEVNSLASFVQITEAYDSSSRNIVYRGQAKKRNLIPCVARKNRKIDSTEQEKAVLAQLQLLGAPYLEGINENQLDLLVLAQHFGLKTRLLDWTSNPLAALWFACSDTGVGDTYVYVLVADELQEKNVYSKDPFATALTRVFQPRLNNPRIIAQHGWFTLHRYSKTSQAFVPIDINPDTKKHLKEIKIPADKRQEILFSLERHGISRRTLFPDLEGLCKHLNWRHDLP